MAGLRGSLHRLWRRSQFGGGFLSLLLNPFHIARSRLFREIRWFAPRLSGRVLDFGCGAKPYRSLFTSAAEYVGVDLEQTGHDHSQSLVDVFYDGKCLPFPDGHFDAVFSSEVLEHIFNLEQILAEISRVTRPQGKLLLTVPFTWDEHEIPYDFARYTSFGLRHLLQAHGFTVIENRKTAGYFLTSVQMFTAYVYQHLLPANRYLRILLGLPLIFPIHLLAEALNVVLPRRDQWYLDNVIYAVKADERTVDP